MNSEKALFDSENLGNTTCRNRLVRMVGSDHRNSRTVTDSVVDTYINYCNEGTGMIITEYNLVIPWEKNFPVMGFYDDEQIDDHKKLIDAVHEHDVKIILQPVCIGSCFIKKRGDDPTPIAPSGVINPDTHTPARKITRKEIKEVQIKFAEAALRAKKAGYDGIEIYGTHGFLISQFVSPAFNRRTDQYGGTFENRMRMLIETIDLIREYVGAEFPVLIKISIRSEDENDLTGEEILQLCHVLEEHQVTTIDIFGNWTRPGKDGEISKNLARRIADELSIPVILTGNLCNYEEVHDTLMNTKIKFFGTDRPLVCKTDAALSFRKHFYNEKIYS